MNRFILLMLSATAMIAAPSVADAAVYTASRGVGSTGSVNISITTDNTLGALTASNILAYNILVSDGTSNFDLTNLNSTIGQSGLDLTATVSDLLYNFSSTGYFLFQNPNPGSGGPFFCFQGNGCFDFAGGGEGLAPVGFPADEVTRYQGTQIVASVAGGVPEPATWAMMLLGFGAVGYGMRRQRRTTVRLMQTA